MNAPHQSLWRCNPIPMPFAEVYTGLETRTIDAQNTRINDNKNFRSAEIPF
ncbi:hypothetical protein ACLB1M_28080 [Escherichia coli]